MFFFLFFSTHLFAGTLCVGGIPEQLDPHQKMSPIESYLAKKLYRRLIETDATASIAETWTKKDDRTWRIKIKKGLEFNQNEGWRSFRGLNALDVQFSLKRQLTKFARSEYDLATFIPAKINQLEGLLLDAKVLSPLELELSFSAPMTEAKLKELLGSETGAVVSLDFNEWIIKKNRPLFYQVGLGLYDVKNKSQDSLELVLVNHKKDLAHKSNDLRIQKFNPETLSYKLLKNSGCQGFLNPKKSLSSILKQNNIPVKIENWGMAKSVLFLNKELKLSNDAFLNLHEKITSEVVARFNPDSRLHGFFNTLHPMKALNSKLQKVSSNFSTLYFCEDLEDYQIDREELAEYLAKVLSKQFGHSILVKKVSCPFLAEATSRPDSVGSVQTILYPETEDLRTPFSCDESWSRMVLGFCLKDAVMIKDENELKRRIDQEFYKTLRLVPLFSSINQLHKIETTSW